MGKLFHPHSLFLQMDELWSYLKNKSRQLWVFIALESETEFWINFESGSRTLNTANRLVKGIRQLGKWGDTHILKVTSDKSAAYKNALADIMGDIQYAYLQIVKRRVKRRLVIERLNLTLRMHVSYLHRKTLGYCKNKINFSIIMWINLFDYNYIQSHKSLRIRINDTDEKFVRKFEHNTPAMKIGLTNSQLNQRYMITALIPRE